MKSLVFDAGPIISLDLNNLLWLIEPLKKEFNGRFYITSSVKKEIVDKPLEIRKYKFEAIQVEKLIEDNIIEIINDDISDDLVSGKEISQYTQKLHNLANQVFMAHGNYIKIVHYAEMSVIAAGISLDSSAIAIDEKTTRMLVEAPGALKDILKSTLHTSIKVNDANLREFRNITEKIKIIRSVELAAIAYELGMLNKYITKIPDAKKSLLDSVLWGLKLSGCAVSSDEIEKITRLEIKY